MNKLIQITMFIIVVMIVIMIFLEIPTEVKIEANKIVLEPPMIFIIMFLCLIFAIFFFWMLIEVEIPRCLGGKKGEKEAEENLKKLNNLLNKLMFWKNFANQNNRESGESEQ